MSLYDKISVCPPFVTFCHPEHIYKNKSAYILMRKCGKDAAMDYRVRMRNLREDRDKSQREVAEALGTSQTMYSRYERGINEMPIRMLVLLCEYYEVTADYLLGLTEED